MAPRIVLSFSTFYFANCPFFSTGANPPGRVLTDTEEKEGTRRLRVKGFRPLGPILLDVSPNIRRESPGTHTRAVRYTASNLAS